MEYGGRDSGLDVVRRVRGCEAEVEMYVKKGRALSSEVKWRTENHRKAFREYHGGQAGSLGVVVPQWRASVGVLECYRGSYRGV